MTTLIYLHGFASSPHGSKVSVFREKAAALGLTLRAPDLNQPSFERLTVTAGLQTAAEAIEGCAAGPVYLIGSSLGGLMALHTLAAYPQAAERVYKLMLLAPGLGLAQRWAALYDIEAWREKGWQEAHHYGADEVKRIHYGFYEDAQQYDGFSVVPPVPTHIVHGRHDATVPVVSSRRYANLHPLVSLDILEAEHGLTSRTLTIWETIRWFFDLL